MKIYLFPFILNTSTGGSGLTYLWDFGDGGTSNAQSPTHNYTTLNTFTVQLIVTAGNGCADTITKNVVVNTFIADFSYLINCVDNNTIFTLQDLSNTNANSWLWNFSDGTSSSIQNPIDSFNTSNTSPYAITLTSSDSNGCTSTVTKMYYPPDANYTPDTFSCASPLTVNFINLSTGIGTLTYLWDFDDGDSSFLQNPSHTFYSPYPVYYHSFYVTHTVTNNYGCTDEITKQVIISKPKADLYGIPTSGCIPLLVNFHDTSSSMDQIVSWEWDFGDGNTSTFQNPSNTYTNLGEYTVSLIITTLNGCKDTIVKTNYIKTGIKPDFIDFTISPIDVCHDSLFSQDTLCYNGLYLFSGSSGFNNPLLQVNYWYWSLGYFPYNDSTYSDSSFFQNASFSTGHISPGLDTVLLVSGLNGCYDSIYKRIWNQFPIAGICVVKEDSSAGFCSDWGACSTPVTLGFHDCSIGNDTLLLYQMEDLQTNQITNLNPNDTTFITFNKAGLYQFNIEVGNDTVKNGGCYDCNKNYILTIDSVEQKFSVIQDTSVCNKCTFIYTDSSFSTYGTIRQWYWYFGDGSTSTLKNPTHCYQNSGTYIIQEILFVEVYYWCGKTKPDTLLCIYNAYDTINVNISIKTKFTLNDTIICQGETVFFTDTSFSVSPIISWAWNFGDSTAIDTNQNPTHIYEHSGYYSVTLVIMNADSCVDSLKKINYINVLPFKADFYATDTVNCPGIPFNFTNQSIGSNLTYLWDFGDGQTSTLQNPSHFYNTSGNFTVSLIITNSLLCDDTLTLINYIEVYASPSALFGADTLWANCPPLPVLFLDSSSSDVVQWEWDFGDGYTSEIQNSSHLYNMSGNYDVQLIVTNSNSCSDTLIKNSYININGPSGTFTIKPYIPCVPSTVTFIAQTTNTTQYFWDFGNGIVNFFTSNNGDSVTYTYSTSGVYNPFVILKDSMGCALTISGAPISMDRLNANFDFGDSIRCDLSNIFFFNSTLFYFPASFHWSFGDGDNSILSTPSHYYDSSGIYNITLSATSSLGCFSDTTKTIIIHKAPDLILLPNDTMGCIPFSLTFSGINTDTSVFLDSWLWDFDDGTTSSNYTENHTYINTGNYHVNLIILYGDSACSKDTVINVKTFKWPTANFVYDPAYPYLPSPIVFFQDQSINANLWHWSFGNGDTSIIKNPSYTYQQSGEYTITLIVSNQAGCSDTAWKKIYISPNEFIKVPEAFSPNGDGQNDEFYLFYAGNFVSLEFRIFNRWGEMVFETTDKKQGWDGTYKGKLQEEGGYSYYVTAKTASSEPPIFIKGTLTLIR